MSIKLGENEIVQDIDKSIKAVTLLIEGLDHLDVKEYELALKKYNDALLLYREREKE